MHVMAIAPLAMLAGWQYERWGRAVPLAYLAALAVGLAAIALAYATTLAGDALLVLAAACGILVALAQPLPRLVGIALAGATGLAVGLDSPPEAISLDEANRMLAGTALGAAASFAVIAAVVARFPGYLPRIGARVLGSWIAASAMLVLALRLAP